MSFIGVIYKKSQKGAVAALTITDSEIPALDSERMSIYECICYFLIYYYYKRHMSIIFMAYVNYAIDAS
jgi:hypothetical protein